MTIAAGLLCLDGIVIAADTQESGYMKNDAHKYQYVRVGSWCGAVMGAGTSMYADMYQQKFIRRFAPAHSAPVPTMEEIEDYALELFNRHAAPLSIYPERERPEAHMLIAIQPNGESGELATWCGTAFVHRYPCAFVGIGSEMAVHLYENFRYAAPHCHPMRQVAGLAIYMLSQIKAIIPECGGQTELAMLGKDGHVYYLSDELIAQREQKYKDYDRAVSSKVADVIMEDCKDPTPETEIGVPENTEIHG